MKMKKVIVLVFLLGTFSPEFLTAQPAPALAKGTNDIGQTRFLELVKMTNYIAKLKDYNASGGTLPVPTEALLSADFQKFQRFGAEKEYGWVWTPQDQKILGLSVDEIYRACGAPDRETENRKTAAWGHVGYLSNDGKGLSKLVVFPYLSERDEIFKKFPNKPPPN